MYISVFICIYLYLYVYCASACSAPAATYRNIYGNPGKPLCHTTYIYIYYAHIHVETYGWVNTTSQPTHLLLEERSNPFCKL